MHLVLILLVQVHAEWVEISQQHYVKPLRPSSIYTALEKPDIVRTTKGNRIYINHSLPEHNWNEDVMHKMPNFESSSVKSVIAKPETSEQTATRIIEVEDIETTKRGSIKLSKPVTVQSDKTADYINHEVPTISNAVIVHRVKPTEATHKPVKHGDFEIKPLEVYNLSDLELITEKDITTVMNKKNVHAPLTSTAATILLTSSEKSLIKKIPNRQFTQVTEQGFSEDDWPKNEDRYEYVVQIVPSNSNKRRVEIVRNTAKPNLLKATDNIVFDFHKPTTTSTSQTTTEMSSTKEIFLVRDTTMIPKITLNSNSQHIRQKPKTKATPTTIKNESEMETAIFGGDDNDQTKVIHLSTNTNSMTKKIAEKMNNLKTIDPDKVMIHEILKDENKPTEITFQKLTQSNTGKIKRVYPTKIIKVDKNGHEIDGSIKIPGPITATYMTEIIANIKNSNENEDKNFYRIPHRANVKNSVNSQKYVNETVERNTEIIHPVSSQASHDIEDVTVSVEDDDEIHKTPFKDNLNPIPHVTTKKTPILTTAETKYSINVFDTDTELGDPGSYESYITLRDKIPEFITKEQHFNHEQKTDSSKANGDVKIDLRKFDANTHFNQLDTAGIEKNIKIVKDQMVTEKLNEQVNFDTVAEDRNQDTKDETLSSGNKPSTMETLMKVLKIVTDTIKRNTRRNFNSKIRYLEDLRDTISRSIEDRIDAAFPDDNTAKFSRSRQARSTQAQSRGHVEFPSSESALMTISFLTFAVYLIKLVLQIIQAYKNKTMMMMPTVVAAIGRAYKHSKN